MIYYKKKSWIKKIFKKRDKIQLEKSSFFAIFKKTVFSFLILFFLLLTSVYGVYLYYFPKITNEENIEKYINDYLKDFSCLSIDIDNLKIKPNIKLELNIKVNQVVLKTSENNKILILDKLNSDINLISLLSKKIDINKLEVNEINAFSRYLKNKKYDLFEYIDLDKIEKKESFLKLANLNLLVKATKINLFDLNTNKKFDIIADKINIQTSFDDLAYKNSKILLNGQIFADNLKLSDFNLNFNYKIKQGKIEPKNINIDFNSNNLELSKIQGLLALALKTLKVNFNSKDYILAGFIDGKIKLKSDFKKLSSSGALFLKDIKIINKPYKITLENINSTINFDDNQIKINNLEAFYENNKISLFGHVDNFANLNLKIKTDKIELKRLIGLVNSSVFVKNKISLDKLKELKGLADFVVLINGPFKNPTVVCNSQIKDFLVKFKKNDAEIKSDEINSKITKDGLNAFGKVKYFNPLFEILNPNLDFKLVVNALNDSLMINSLNIFSDKKEIINASGQIIAQKDNYNFKNFKVKTLDKIKILIKDEPFVTLKFLGDIDLSGDVENPLISTNAQLFDIKDKFQKFNLLNSSLNIENNNFYFSSTNAKFLGDSFEIIAQGKIKDYLAELDIVYFNAPYLNLDKLKSNNSNVKTSYPIDNLRVNISTVETLDMFLNNVSFVGKLKDNVFELNNLSALAFDGNIEGDIKYNLLNNKIFVDLIFKNINTRLLNSQIKELKDYSIALSGNLNSILKAQFYGENFNDILKTFDGYIKFNIDNGELNQLAKLERFLQAGNILSQSILKLTLNSAVSAISKQNTGDFKTIEGTVKIKDGISDIQYIKTQGSNMSLYITGKFNLLSYIANLKILGKIPSSIVNVMGEFGKFSAQKLVNNLDKDAKEIITSLSASPFEKMLSVELSEEELSKIPKLANETSTIDDRKFVVRIIGDIRKTASIKLFRWHSK